MNLQLNCDTLVETPFGLEVQTHDNWQVNMQLDCDILVEEQRFFDMHVLLLNRCYRRL